MQEYTYIRTVGEGAYGDVWLTQRRGGAYCAVKVFKQAHEDPEIKALAKREARILQSVSHINCVKLLDAFKSKSGRVYLVFEYVERNLLGELDVQPFGLTPAATKLIAWQLLHAAAYLHGLKMVHRDIKPANILLTAQGLLKLCDFGFARSTRCGVREVQPLSTYVVTRWYRSPEVLVSAPYGPSADIWSIGCTLAEVATGRPLFGGRSTADQLWRIMRCRGPLPTHLAGRLGTDPRLQGIPVPKPSRSLRQRLPELDPRLHQLIDACLQLDPETRLSAEELLQLPYFWDVPLLVAGSPLAGLYCTGAQPYGSEMAPSAGRAVRTSEGEVLRVHQQQQSQMGGESRHRPMDPVELDEVVKKKQGLSTMEGERGMDGRQGGGDDGSGEGELQSILELREAQQKKEQQQRAGDEGSCGGALGAAAATAMAGRGPLNAVTSELGETVFADVQIGANESAGVRSSGVLMAPSESAAKTAEGAGRMITCDAHGGLSVLRASLTDRALSSGRPQQQQQQQEQQHGDSELPTPQEASGCGTKGSLSLGTSWRRSAPFAESSPQVECDMLPGTLSSPGGSLMGTTNVAAVAAAARLGLSLPYKPNPDGSTPPVVIESSLTYEPTASVTFAAMARDFNDDDGGACTASLVYPEAGRADADGGRVGGAAAAAEMAVAEPTNPSDQMPMPPLQAVAIADCVTCTAADDSAATATATGHAGNTVSGAGYITLSGLPTLAAAPLSTAAAASPGDEVRKYDSTHRQPPPGGAGGPFAPAPRAGSATYETASDMRLMRVRVPAGGAGGAAYGLRSQTAAQRRGIFGHHHQQAAAQQRQLSVWAAARASLGGRPVSSLGQIPEPDSVFDNGDDGDGDGRMRIGSSDLGYTAAGTTVMVGGAAGSGADRGSDTFTGSGFTFPALQWPVCDGRTSAGGGLTAAGMSSCGFLDSIPFDEMMTPVGAPDMPSYTGIVPPHRRPPLPSSESPRFIPSCQNNNSDSLFLLSSFIRNPAVVGSQRASQHGGIIIGDGDPGSRPTKSESAVAVSGGGGGVVVEDSVHNLDGDMGTTPCSSRSSVTAAARGGSWGNLLGRIGRSGGSASSSVLGAPYGSGSDSGVHARVSSLRAQPAQRSRLGSGMWGTDGAPPPAGVVDMSSPAAAAAAAATTTPSGGAGSGQVSKVHPAGLPSAAAAPSVPYISRRGGPYHMGSMGTKPSQETLAALLSAGVQLSSVDVCGGGRSRLTRWPPQPPPARRGVSILEAWRRSVARVPADSKKVVVKPASNGSAAVTAVEAEEGEDAMSPEVERTTPGSARAAASVGGAKTGAEQGGEGAKVAWVSVGVSGAIAGQQSPRLEKQSGTAAAVMVEAAAGVGMCGDRAEMGGEVWEKKKKKKGVKGLWRSISKVLGLRPSSA